MTATMVAPRLDGATTRFARYAPLSGIAFVVFFIAGVVASSPPANSASDATWVANYTGSAHRAGHAATGVCLIVAGLCLMSFMTAVWMRVVAASQSIRLSPLPVVAAGVAAACMAIGGALMGGAISLVGSGFTPNADVLRLCNGAGFVMVGLGAMLAASLSVASLTAQARSAGFFGRKMAIFGYAVSVILLAAVAFIPIVALLVWLVVVAITLLRRQPIHPSPLG